MNRLEQIKTHDSLRNEIAKTMKDPVTSYWLKGVLTTIFNRDPVDALQDSHYLYHLLKRRWELMVDGEITSVFRG